MAIDDEQDILDALEVILKASGYSVKTYNNISSIDEVSNYNPDLVILDVLLVGNSGKVICTMIRSNPKTEKIPILLLSAHPSSQLKNITKKYNATAFLPKPFDLDVLLAVVRKLTS